MSEVTDKTTQYNPNQKGERKKGGKREEKKKQKQKQKQQQKTDNAGSFSVTAQLFKMCVFLCKPDGT